MLEILGPHWGVALIGLVTGTLLGLAARLGRFCTLGAIEDTLYGGSTLRLRMWGVAIGFSVLGTFGLAELGLVARGQSAYLQEAWNPLASIVGGGLFGYGMALAGNCGYGAIARLGGGDLRSFVIVLVMGIATYVVLAGPLAPLRIAMFPQLPVSGTPPGLADWGARLTGLPVTAIGLALGALLLLAALASPVLRSHPQELGWACAVGVAIVGAWVGTSWVAEAEFGATPVVSHSFAGPLGETILWFMSASGMPVTFAVGSVAGVWFGALLGSLRRAHFRWEACEDPRELRRQIIGAAIMGAGAVIAMGCTVGQGITAFSVLALSAPVTFVSIFAGAALGLRQLILGFRMAH
ncbi:YeeE/YedE family protein [Roseivivax sp. CAU 1753]